MTDLRRTVRCSNCGNEAVLQVSSGLDVKELVFAGKCAQCGSSVQVNYNIVGNNAEDEGISMPSDSSVDLDDELSSDIPSDALKNLMGE